MCFWIYMRYFKRKDTVYHHPEHPSVQTSDSRFGARHVQCLMAFLGLGMAYCMRVNLSVAIVSMTQKSTGTDFPVLPWDESMKGTILSSFFWGYLLLQVPAGQLAEKFGPKFLLAGTVFFSGFVTVLTPYAAIHGGFYWMVATRILQGAVQGFLLPCANVLVAKWTPAPERGRIFTWVFNGTKFGILVTMPVAGYLADSPWGWPSIFYVSGGAAILWSILYCYIGANSPQEHPTISESERKYILSSMPSSSPQQKMLKTPWKAILTSIPMWAIAVAHTSLAWGYWTLLTQIPSYVNSVMGINLKKSGLLSALPYLTSFVMAFVFSAICDWMINKEILSRSASKKIWSCVAMWGPAFALCILAFSGKHAILALSMLIAAVAPNSAIFLGFLSNHIDLSPNFAGTLMGITNGLSNIGSVAAPLFAGYIVTDTTSLIQWQIVFLTSAAIFFFDSRFGARHVQCLMAFLGIATAYCLRVNLSVAIVSMTQKSSPGAEFPALPWDESMKGTILSSFFWGYLLLQVPAGQLAERFGPKFLLVATLFFSGFVTVVTPYAAIHGGFHWMVVTRILQGAAQGFLYPSTNFLLSKWAPTPERGRLFTWVFNGTQFGTLVTMAVTGFLADSRWGWPSIFYVSGGVAILWSIVYCFVGSNSPQEHPTITESEKKYILNSLPSSSAERKSLKTPWKAIATSIPMWALLLAHLGQNWGFWTLLTQIPSYLNSVFGLNIKKSGLLSALPYASSFVMGFVFSGIGDSLNNKRILSRTASKKIWNSIALWVPALALCVLAFSGEHETLALFMLVIAVASNSAVNLGYLSNHLDLSPNFAGTLMGITNGLANITSITGPLFVGYIVTDTTSLPQWQIVFLTSAAVFFVGNLIFIIFGTAEVQPWNFPPEEQTPKATSSAEQE